MKIMVLLLSSLFIWIAPTDGLAAKIRVYFHQPSGRWQFFDGDKVFVSRGVVGVRYAGEGTGDDQTYGKNLAAMGLDPQAFARQVTERLQGWGFNTIGPWSDEGLYLQTSLYYTVIISGSRQAIQRGGPLGEFPDVFSPQFKEAVEKGVAVAARRHLNRPNLIGYFTDNELEWSENLLDKFLHLADGQPGKEAAKSFLHQHLGVAKSFQRLEAGLNPDLRAAFMELVAEEYFRTFKDALARHDPGRLNLGCRFAAPKRYSPVAAKVAGRYVDVISLNRYPRSFGDLRESLREIHRLTGKPILLGEFSVRARDSGLPNTKGGGFLVLTQQQRGKWYRQFVCELMQEPYIVGYHWFRWLDEPAQGRFDGENSNYSLVDVHNQPYRDFTEQVKLQVRPCP